MTACLKAWALLLEYDGTPFVGWQRQATGVSVQSVLEDAASRLCNGAAVHSTIAGRTDAGVHASAQVALLSLPDRYQPRQVQAALNYHMQPHPVAVLHAAPAPDGWNPRFSAIGRRYRYRILNRRGRPTFDRDQVWHVERPLDIQAMQRGASHLLGQHDFTSFRAVACQAKSPLRTLDRLDITRTGDVVEILAAARSFLHHQVRNMVGTLKWVGEGRWPPDKVADALAAADRRAGGPTAPAAGLCLIGVRYPDDPFTPPPGGPEASGTPGQGSPQPSRY